MFSRIFSPGSSFIVAISCSAILISGCESAQQRLKEREAVLENFAAKVAMHLMDRNPSTMESSVRTLMKEELNEDACSKLQDEHLLPQSPLDIMKVIYDTKKTGQSNLVKVGTVKPLAPIGKDVVPFRVSGKEITKTPGKPDENKNFTFTIAIKLTDDMDGFPRVIDVKELPADKAISKPHRRRA